MSIRFLSRKMHARPNLEQIDQKALIVCAGTMTTQHVSSMGADFNLFKNIFYGAKSYHNEGTWEALLEKSLKDYHSKNVPMPAFQLIAKKGKLVGGVATVPCKGEPPLMLDPNNTSAYEDTVIESEYKDAVRLSIQAAQTLHLPLYIQVLGMGFHGWSAVQAAELFADVINEIKAAEHLPDITLFIHKTRVNSPDRQFKKTLVKLTADPLSDKQIVKINNIIDDLIKKIETKMKDSPQKTEKAGTNKIKKLRLFKKTLSRLDQDAILDPTKKAKFVNVLDTIHDIYHEKRHVWNFFTDEEFKAIKETHFPKI